MTTYGIAADQWLLEKQSFAYRAQEPTLTYCSVRSQQSSGDRFWGPLKKEGQRVCQDYRNMYSRDSMLNFGVGVGVHAIISNTSIDQEFRDWYQDDVRCDGTDNLSSFFKVFGEGKIFIPVMVVGDLVYRYCQDADMVPQGRCVMGEFASRTARSYLVGFPTLIIGQNLIGSARPSDHDSDSSHWTPFEHDHGISGHAFLGATPFIVAAQMTERPWLKATFYTLSALPAWSRVNDDAHYLSQAMLGWYLSYLSVRAVSKTDGLRLPKGMTIFPITGGNTIGAGFQWRR